MKEANLMDNPVIIEDYNSNWSRVYEKEKGKLIKILNDRIISNEHIGRYHQLKKELANKYRFDRVSYTEAKGLFIQNVLKKAKEEVE
jgi:GrpB-like predicted nucleotidyltransferase (UPF0157 family)